MVLVGALVQVLLVPPSGYRCFRRRPGCRASARGVFVAHCFPSSSCPWQQRPWPCVGIFPSTPCFLCCWGAMCSLTEVFIIVWSLSPSWTPLRHVRTPSSACVSFFSLSSAASWLLSSFPLLACCFAWVVLWPLPPLCFPLDGRFRFVWACVVFASSVAWIPRLQLCTVTHFSPLLQWSYPVVTKELSEVGQLLLTVPPFLLSWSPFEFVCLFCLFCVVFIWWLPLWLYWDGPFSLCVLFPVCFLEGGRFPVEPWLGCNAVSSTGAVQLCFLQFSLERPSAAKPAHMVRCADFLYCYGVWPTRWESGFVWNIQMPSCASGPLRRTCWDDDA